MRFRAQPFVMLAVGIAACGGSEAPDAQSDRESVPIEPAPPLQLSRPDSAGVLDFVNEVRDAPTAAEWVAAHPEWADSFVPNDVGLADEIAGGLGHLTPWCLIASSEEPVDSAGVTVTRQFYFYAVVPAAPSDFAIPEMRTGIEYHLENCRLGLVTAEVFGASGIDQGRQALIDRFAEELGPPPLMTPIPELGLSGLAGTVHDWVRGPETVGIGVRSGSSRPVSYVYTDVMDATWSAGRLGEHANPWAAETWEVVLEAAAMPERGRQIVRASTADFLSLRNAAGLVTVATDDRDSLAAASPAALGVRYTLIEFLLGNPESPAYSVARDQPSASDLLPALEERGALYQPVRFAGHRVEYTGSFADSARAHMGATDWTPLLSVVGVSDACDRAGAIDTLERLEPTVEHSQFRPWLHTLLGDAYATRAYIDASGDRASRTDSRRQGLGHYAEAVATEANPERKATAWRKAFLVANNHRFDPARFECRGL